jgi:hypothetical protein
MNMRNAERVAAAARQEAEGDGGFCNLPKKVGTVGPPSRLESTLSAAMADNLRLNREWTLADS